MRGNLPEDVFDRADPNYHQTLTSTYNRYVHVER